MRCNLGYQHPTITQEGKQGVRRGVGRRRLHTEGRERLTDECEARRAEGVVQGAALTLRVCLGEEVGISWKTVELLPCRQNSERPEEATGGRRSGTAEAGTPRTDKSRKHNLSGSLDLFGRARFPQ